MVSVPLSLPPTTLVLSDDNHDILYELFDDVDNDVEYDANLMKLPNLFPLIARKPFLPDLTLKVDQKFFNPSGLLV